MISVGDILIKMGASDRNPTAIVPYMESKYFKLIFKCIFWCKSFYWYFSLFTPNRECFAHGSFIKEKWVMYFVSLGCIDWLIAYMVFYAVSAIFRPHNGGNGLICNWHWQQFDAEIDKFNTVFSSTGLKARELFWSPVVRPSVYLCVCLSVHLSVKLFIFSSSSSTIRPISIRLGTKHPRVKGIQVFFSNEGPHPFPKEENNEIAK